MDCSWLLLDRYNASQPWVHTRQITRRLPHPYPKIKHTQIAEKRKARLAEAGGGVSTRLCRICKVKIDPQRHYCNDCAYKKVRHRICNTNDP